MARVAAQYASMHIAPSKDGATVVALSGELGAGKTTFAQAMAAELGVQEAVASPTFVIEKIYALSNQKWQRLIHIDAYRLHDAKELRAIGWDEIVADPGNLILIEWPEHIPDLVPPSARRVAITIQESDTRVISYDT